MRPLRVLRARVIGVCRKARFEQEMEEELRFHLRMRAQEEIRRGLAPEKARAHAVRKFGNFYAIKDACRDIGGGGALETFLHDVRFAWRNLAKEKAFAGAAVVALVLGIGANTALFTVLSAVLLRPLPFDRPDELMSVWSRESANPENRFPMSYPDFEDYRAQNRSFAQLGAFRAHSFVVGRASGEAAHHLEGAYVTSDIFPLLRVRPAIGRAFERKDEDRGGRTVIISDKLWEAEFGRSSDVLGATMLVDGHEHSVIGVMPPGFHFPIQNNPAEIWITPALEWEPRGDSGDALNMHRDGHYVGLLGRLRPGTTRADAKSEMDQIARTLAARYFETNRTIDSAFVDPWLADLTKKVRPALLLLIAASLCVLCVACANVANLLLARGTTRKKEISIRAALGAGRRRILRQLLTESLLLGVLGAVAALFVALAGTRAIVMLLPPDFPRLNEIAPDVRVLAFTGLLAIVTSCVFGFAPAWRVARSSIAHQLNDCSRGASETRHGRRLRSTVVAAEMTLAFVLVAGACFLLSGLWRLQNVALGFDPENLATVWMSLPDERDAQAPVRCAAFYEKFLSRVSSMPGVQSASAVHLLPLTVTQSEADFEIIGRPMLKADWPRTRTHAINNTGYFRTMGIPLLRGREFNADDRRDAPPVVIINETLARKHFPNQEPLGQHIRPGLTDSGDPLVREIVGVVGDVRSAGLAGEAKAEAYLPHAQCATGEMAIVMRSAVPLEKLAAGVRDMAATMEPSASVYDARLMSEYVEAAVAQPRLNSTLLAAFAVVALALSGIGVYSVMAYSVAQRRHEIGLRLALGAQKFAVFQLLLGDGARIATWALLAGGAATFAIVPMLRKLAHTEAGDDLFTIGFVALLLALVALLASWLPAQRAACEDPLRALGQR